ncbi:RNA polymerase II-associated protein 3 [Hyla sarda]|uniref:RNA polymerase II-associated protein 3 n=1 Tax=Hyla sarda TaxID=327740 RepID=UPI0024C3B5FA|nr:RNA polymerase II-associated protein 3 [Hyla sarda]XP_056429987.1 RNA polymerase II-associated protein 3 [Hyla sarda]
MSSPNKALELQLQMKQNAEELQDFMRELESWEEDIKQKDAKLSNQTGTNEETLPPIRNKDYRKKKKTKSKVSTEAKKNEENKNPKRKLNDYNYWDKLDVDKALQELDKEDNTNESMSAESDSGDEDGIIVNTEKALAEKEKGNNNFKAGKYDDAIQCYTRGMNADPYNAVLPTNRASAFFRLKKYAVAESDCNLAIALNHNYWKAYARRGACRVALKNFQGAKEDYEKVLELEPNNFEATNELKKIALELPSSSSTSQEKEGCRENVQEKSSEVAEEEQERIEVQQLKQKAIVQKDLGNAYFKEGKYEFAIECYTQGIAADGTNALLPANRAMAYLKIQKYQEAEDDCTQAIALDTSYGKAFARRGTARVMLRKLKEAKEDFEMVLKLEPGNKQAISELAKISQELNEKTVNPTQQTSDENKEIAKRRVVKAMAKPIHLRSTKPLRRMEIEEIGGILLTPVDVLNESNDAGNVNDLVQPEDPDESKEELNPKEPTSIHPEAPSAKMLKIEEISDLPTFQENPDKNIQPLTRPLNTEKDQPMLSVLVECDVPGVPANSFQLESDLRRMKGNMDMLYTYLKQIEPRLYVKLFQKALDPDVFNEIIKILRRKYIENDDADLVFEILKTFSELKRFDMAVMFLSNSEKEDVHALFAYIEMAKKTNDSCAALKKKYGL